MEGQRARETLEETERLNYTERVSQRYVGMRDGQRDGRCDERGEGTGDEERQMDHHDITLECMLRVCVASSLASSQLCVSVEL